MREYALLGQVFVDQTVVGCTVGGSAEDVCGGRGRRERKGENAGNDRSGKPHGEGGSEKRVGGAQGGRMGLETTMGELPPVGERGRVDLEKGGTGWLVIGSGEGGQTGEECLTCLGEELRFFDGGDKIRDVVH